MLSAGKPNEKKRPLVPHKGLKLPKRFTNLPLDSSRCLGEKGKACIKRNKILNTHDPIKISYFLHILPFSPWDSKFKPMSENTGHFGEVCEPFR